MLGFTGTAEEQGGIPGLEKYTCGHYTYRILEDGSAQIVAYSGAETEINIPAEVDSIGNDVLLGCSRLTVTVSPGSAAEQYCKEHNIPYAAE